MKSTRIVSREALQRTLLVGLLFVPLFAGTYYASRADETVHVRNDQIHINPPDLPNSACHECHPDQWNDASPAMGPGEPIVSAHKRHGFSVFLKFAPPPEWPGQPNAPGGCVLCHQVTVLGYGTYEGDPSYTTSAFNPRSPADSTGGNNRVFIAGKQVNPARCVHCHGKWTRFAGSEHCGTIPGCDPQRNYARLDPRGCVVRCHGQEGIGGWVVQAHEQVTASPFLEFIETRYANDGNYCLLCHGGYAWYQVPEWNPSNP